MTFVDTPLSGLYLIECDQQVDARGFFARIWCKREFTDRGLNADLVQISVSYNRCSGTLRGLHYQAPPFEETKLVRCTRGALFDVAVDLRAESPTYLQWYGTTLTAQNRTMIYIPEGFAHGFQTLEDDTEAVYHITEFYAPSAARGARWNDPVFGIQWPDAARRILSAKDERWPAFTPIRPTQIGA